MYDRLCVHLFIFSFVNMIIMWNISMVCSSLIVYREERDNTASLTPICMDRHASKVTVADCTCDADYNTIMSTDKNEYYCLQPFNIQCYYSLLKTKQTYLIGHNSTNDTARIIKSGSEERDTFQSISQISLWNYHSVGNWYDITELARPFFKLDDNEFGGNNLTVVNLNTILWQGHLLRFYLKYKEKSYEPCLTLKVQGKRRYPFDFDEFRSHFAVRKTTTKPTLLTTTYIKTTTNVTITTTTPQPATTTKTTSSNSTTIAETKTKQLISTTKAVTTFNATTTKATHTNKTTPQKTTQAATSFPSTSNSTDLTTHQSTKNTTEPTTTVRSTTFFHNLTTATLQPTETVTTFFRNTTNRPKTAAYVAEETTSNWKYYVLCGFSICCIIIIIVLVYIMKKRRKFESVDFELPKHIRLSVCKESFENPTYEATDENNDKFAIADSFDNPTYDEVAKENNEITIDDDFDDLSYNAEEQDDNSKEEGFESPTYDAVAPPDYVMMGEKKQSESEKNDEDSDKEFTINL